jgi:ribonuclease BN (tRNA processing enzyme)
MLITFHGVRGSYPVPGKDTIIYGGNTTCVSFNYKVNDKKIHRLIIDSGSGIINLGREIIDNYFKGEETLRTHIFFTHLHPDHTQGFPFFGLNFFKNAEVNLYGMETLGSDIEKILTSQMAPPNFPIEYRRLKSHRILHILEDGDGVNTGLVTDEPIFNVKVMQTFSPSHPQQGAMYYKITEIRSGKSVACIWDNESKVGGDKAVINFIQGCDVVIHDTQYTTLEYENNEMVVQGFGHSSYEMAINNALQANVKTLICLHYNPIHTDKILTKIEKDLNKRFADNNLQIIFSKEGMTYSP